VTTAETEPAPDTTRRIGYDLLRIISICGVVSIHTFGAIGINPDMRGSASWMLALLLSTGFSWAVPVFVMLAGALSLRENTHVDGPMAFYVKRAKRIVPATIVWTIIYFALVRVVLLGEQLGPTQILLDVFDLRVYPHLYFLWLIGGLYLVAPVVAAFLHGGGRRRALITAATVLGLTLFVLMVPSVLALRGIERPIDLNAMTVWMAFLGYFLAGYAVSLLKPSRGWLIAAGIGVLVFGGLTIAGVAWPDPLIADRGLDSPTYPLTVAGLAVCVFVFGVWLLNRVQVGRRTSRFITMLSEASFGVFLVHLIVLLIPYQLLPGFRDDTSVAQAALAYVFILVVSFAISIGARKVPGLRLIF
jgi:surface polysaccharide O-acyltransferase-like enzyme